MHESFGDLQVLEGVSLDGMMGEVICTVGPSGSGKSTPIRCINGLGHIHVTDRGVIVEHAPPAIFFERARDPRTRAFPSRIL